MDYNNFEEQVHAIILERGKDYFDRGAVKEMQRSVEGWTMTVDGQSAYRVVLNGSEHLQDWFCDCPHRHGPVCKHVTAALYAIRATRDGEINRFLSHLSHEDLCLFVRRQAATTPTLSDAIMRFLAERSSHEQEEEE